MKIILAVLICAALRTMAHDSADEDIKLLLHGYKECQADPKTHIELDKLKNFPNYADDPQVQAHMICGLTKYGVMGKDGKLDKDAVREKLGHFTNDKNQIDNLAEKCTAEKENPGKTAVNYLQCMFDSGLFKDL